MHRAHIGPVEAKSLGIGSPGTGVTGVYNEGAGSQTWVPRKSSKFS